MMVAHLLEVSFGWADLCARRSVALDIARRPPREKILCRVQQVVVSSASTTCSMLPLEASEAFSAGLKESLLQLKERHTNRVWADAEELFNEKVALLPQTMRTREV